MRQQQATKSYFNMTVAVSALAVGLAFSAEPVVEAFVRAVLKDMITPYPPPPEPEVGPRMIDVNLEMTAPSTRITDFPGPGGTPQLLPPAATPVKKHRVPVPVPVPPPRRLDDTVHAAPTPPPASPPPAPAQTTPMLAAPVPMEPANTISMKMAKTITDVQAWIVDNRVILIASLSGALILVLLRNGIELLAVGAHGMTSIRQRFRSWWVESRRERAPPLDRRVNADTLRTDIQRQTRHVGKLVHRSEVLYGQADRIELSSLPGARFVVRHLRRRAAAYLETAERAQVDLEQAEKQWAGLEQDRRTEKDLEYLKRVHKLLRLLGSKVEAAAASAHMELKRIGSSFDWMNLVPDTLPVELRQKTEKLLRLMAGASTVSEALAAYGKALNILKANNAAWREMPA